MAINKKPQQVGLSDPKLVRQATTKLTQDAIAAKGKPAIIEGTAVLPRTTVQATATSVNVTTSANNQVADTTTVYRTSGAIYVSSIDQTVQQVTNKNIVNQIGVSQIIAGNNVTITSSVPGGTGIVTINTTAPALGNISAINLDGNAANVLHGDGSWSADTTTYGNSNVVTLLSSFGSNSISTTGNVTANVFAGNTVKSTGNVTVTANANSWTFGSNGDLVFPTLSVNLHTGGVQSGQVLQFGDPTQQAIITGTIPAANVNAQRLVIQGQRGNGTLSEGGDVYVWAGDADANGGDIQIHAGDADNVATGTGGSININSGIGFDLGGHTTLSAGYSSDGIGGYVSVNGGQGATQGGNILIDAGYGTAGPGGTVTITGGGSSNGIAEFGNVSILSGANAWTFAADSTLYAPGNAVLSGSVIAVGPGANTLAATLADPTLVISSNSVAFIQAAINNVSDIGSADWIAYGHHGNDAGGWADLGFTSAAFGDANYTITGPGDGYVFAQGFPVGAAPSIGGGNLILATGFEGSTKDIIFGTGGFGTSNIFGRISHANNALELSRAGSGITVAGGNISGANVVSANYFVGNGANLSAIAGGNVSGAVGLATYASTANAVAGANVSGFVANANVANTAFLLANGNSNVNIATANGNITLTATSNTTMTITDTGANITGTANISGNVIGGNISTAGQITSTQAGNLSDGGGQLYLNGTGNNRIDFNSAGTGAPTDTTRSAGTKITLFPALSASQVDYAIGVDSATVWTSVPVNSASFKFKWYGNTTEVANLDGTGVFQTAGSISTAGIVKSGVYTTSTIPAAATAGAGARAFVTDADSATFKAAYVGGSGNAVPVFSDGSAWYVG